jgi:hypothetical protein
MSLVGMTAMIAVPLVAYLVLKPRVTTENYDLIHDRMNLAEVEALLGKPTGGSIPAVNFLYLCSTDLREEYAAFMGPTRDWVARWRRLHSRRIPAQWQRDFQTLRSPSG